MATSSSSSSSSSSSTFRQSASEDGAATTSSETKKIDGKSTDWKTPIMVKEPSLQWGEFEPHQHSPSKSMSAVDIDSPALNPKSIDIEGHYLHQPSSSSNKAFQPLLPSELLRSDAISIHTIHLLKHNRRTRTIIASAQQLQQESMKYEDQGTKPRLQSLPATPLLLIPSRTVRTLSSDSGTQTDQRDEAFGPTLSHGTIEMNRHIARKLQGKSVATICAHAGYELSHESALDTLIDVLHEYMTKVCKLLRVAADREALHGYTGFQDVLSQVLQEIGVGGAYNLHTFWKTRIKDYHSFVLKRNSQLREQYDHLRNPVVSSLNECKSPRIKEESFLDIQFPDNDQDSEVTPETSEHTNQSLNYHGLNPLELEEHGRVTTTTAMATEDDTHWYPAPYVKTEPGTENGTRDGSKDRREMETEDHINQGEDDMVTSQSSRSPAVVEDVDVMTSTQGHSTMVRESGLINPKKKRKK